MLGLIKVSLIIFYLQIFVDRGMRIACFTTIGFIVTSTLALVLSTVMACIPMQAFWDRDISGKCLDINALAYATSGIAIAQDIIIIALPLTCIHKLRINRVRKFAVGFMFSIGAL